MTLDLMNIIILFASGLLAVTTIDVLGSLSSRRMNYKYVYLTPISFLVYFCIGYQGHSIATLTWTLIIACLTGIYDGTIGWKLSIILKANFADKEEYTKSLSLSSRISGMIVVSGVFGFLGFMTAGHI
jgi:hypothetical protein